MKPIRKAFVVLLLIAAGGGAAQDRLTLAEAFALALKQNPRILVARNEAEIARNSAQFGNADLLPRLDLVSDAGYRDVRLPTQAGPVYSTTSTTSAQVQLNYTLFDGLGNIYTYKKLQVAGESGKLLGRQEIEAVLLTVSNAYFELASTGDGLSIAEESLQISAERLQRARGQADFGQANALQVLAAQVDLNADSVAFARSQLAWDQARRSLNGLLNLEMDANVAVETDVTFIADLNQTDLLHSAEERNAAFRLALNHLERARLDLKIVGAQNLPQVSIKSAYGLDQTASEFAVQLDNPDRQFSAALTLSWNLFNGFRTRLQKQNARLTIDSQEQLQRQAWINLQEQLRNAFAGYQNNRLVYDIELRNLASAELNFQRTADFFALGQVTSTQFREAQLNLVRAKNNIRSAKFAAKQAELQLLQLSGQLLQDL